MKTSYLNIKEDLDVIERSDSSIKYLSGYIMGFFSYITYKKPFVT